MSVGAASRNIASWPAKRPGHPGLIILPSLAKAATWARLEAALAFLLTHEDPHSLIANHVLEATGQDPLTLVAFPPEGAI